jgi:hypothetical protein
VSDQLLGHVEHGTTGDHVEPFRYEVDLLSRPLLARAPRPSTDLELHRRVVSRPHHEPHVTILLRKPQ